MSPDFSISDSDVAIIRGLAERVASVAALPVQEERRRLWKAHNALRGERPMILLFPEGGWEELLPKSALACESEPAREIEWSLRNRIYHHEHFADDTVIEGEWLVRKAIESSGWGLEPRRHQSTEARGAWAFAPVLNSRDDIRKLTIPRVTHNAEETTRRVAFAERLFDGIFPVREVGVAHISYHLMQQYTYLRGLEQMMVDMFDAPDILHDTMRFLTDAHKDVLRQYQELNVLSLNNDGTYHSSGGVGYTDELPAPGFRPGTVRPEDMWASAESQELAGVGPAQHEEFALQYERELLEPFALTGYGCCEPLTDRLDHVFSIPGIRRLSISPFADVRLAAEGLGDRYIFSWKPRPMDLVGSFSEERIRAYIRNTIELAAANSCVLEMILKDTHTCENHPERFDRWANIAREEVEHAG
ncbi:MAG: hypothetical protein EA426_14700 [Spirochaetaceae bacterium]|nr:MAG: hypothetical protein EA426_14700 [Spirochaetaceae bacterium]